MLQRYTFFRICEKMKTTIYKGEFPYYLSKTGKLESNLWTGKRETQHLNLSFTFTPHISS